MDAEKPIVESDEDDFETFFLQPASSPYIIADKVKEANEALFNETIDLLFKENKVKFREELVDFEPDLTDDDVTSIESYNESIDVSALPTEIEEEQEAKIEVKQIHNINMNIFNTVDEADEEEPEDISDEIGIIEEILCEEPILHDKLTKQDTIVEDELDEHDDVTITDNVSFKVETILRDQKGLTKAHVARKSIPKPIQTKLIDCKAHCIEKLDPGLNLSINKLQISSKPPKICPTLKLQKRNCCEKNPIKIDQKLPVYSGHKSEYGLSLAQLEKREKVKEINKLREQKRYQLIEEFKHRKMQQNEAIFCQWLKNISKRKGEQEKRDTVQKKCLTPTVFDFPSTKLVHSSPARPHTAHFIPKNSAKKVKRPSTSTACVFIEVPQSLLRKGIRVGDILVDKSNQHQSKKLHIMAIS